MKPNRYNNPIKQEARFETVIKPYQELKYPKLPLNKEYWALCNVQSMDESYEFGQLIKSNIITHEQYNGVDNNLEIINKNKQLLPNSNWYVGNFIDVFSNAIDNGNNPGLIYFDTTSMGKVSIKESFYIMQKISECNITDVLLVVNFISKNPYNGNEDNLTSILDKIRKSNSWRILQNDTDWKFYENVISYQSNNTNMTTLIFIKP